MHPSLLRAAVGATLALLAAEVYVRLTYSVSVVYEPGIGYVNGPGRMRFALEGAATSTWLRHGERFTPGAPEGVPRVLVLGDSFTEALMIADAGTFVAVAQNQLTSEGVELALVNAGRSTMSAADYVALAPRYRELFPSSWVTIQLRGNDLSADAWTPGRTRFLRDAPGVLRTELVVEPERTGLRGLWFTLRQRSMLAGYGAIRVGKFRTVPEPPLFRAGYPSPPRQPEAVPPVEEELDLLLDAWNSRLTLLYLSSFDEEDPIEERVRAHCATREISCIFTREADAMLRMQGKAPTGFTNTGFATGHLNEDGHAIAGRLLARELARLQPAIAGSNP